MVTLLAACSAVGWQEVPLNEAAGPPFSPAAALETFELERGFRIELVAAEPLVSDPVAMEIDEDGRMYVVEMPGYPLDVEGSGRVILLRDHDGDGRADQSTVFADGLRLPNGIMRWKQGVLVTDAPDVLYLEDSDGDGRSDRREVVLTGFALTNPQHNTNTPLYGLDNWIYLSNEGSVRTARYDDLFGDTGTTIRFPQAPHAPTLPPNADGRNVRFRPDTRELEMLAARSQFGHAFDPWGRHFLVSNSRPMYHEVVSARYLSRNADLLVPRVVQELPDYGAPARVFPITENPEFQMLTDVGIMTSASGLTLYQGDLFPPPYREAAFVTESVHNLVHAARLREDGVSFRASRIQDEREFLASRDPWFRPVNLYVGPEGALYVIDYYRKIIEHPEWLDDDAIASGELYAGRDRGRIYRIVPEETVDAAGSRGPRLGDASIAELVAALEHPNLWYRRHAQRMLIDRRAAEAVPLLGRLLRESPSAVARVHALWTLDGLGQLDPPLIARALSDESPGVRENAIRLAEHHLGNAPALADRLVELAAEPNARVRFQLLLTLGDVDTPASHAARRKLLLENIEDEWMQIAALSARRVDEAELYRMAITGLTDRATSGRRAFLERITALIGARAQPDSLRRLVIATVAANQGLDAAWWRAASLEGLTSGSGGQRSGGPGFDAEREQLLGMLFRSDPAPVRRAALRLLERLGLPASRSSTETSRRAAEILGDRDADPELRADALRLLALYDPSRYEPLFLARTAPGEPAAVQIAAVQALGQRPGESIAFDFVDRWHQWTPAVRHEAVRALGREPARLRVLVDAVASGRIKATEIDRQMRIRLMLGEDEELRTRARALFSGSSAEASEAVERYRHALSLPGNIDRGAQVFARTCSMCHQYRAASGSAFGPDLGELRTRPRHALLTDIVDPNRSLAEGYELWIVELADGSTHSGVVAGETPTLITLRHPGGGETAIARAEITSMIISEISAMPEELDAQIPPQEMADLIAFLKGAK